MNSISNWYQKSSPLKPYPKAALPQDQYGHPTTWGLCGCTKRDSRAAQNLSDAELCEDFKELFELFFDVYLDKSGDYELLEVIRPFYAFRGLVVASPIWYPNISLETRRKLFNFIKNVLDAEEFDYKGVAKYLEG